MYEREFIRFRESITVLYLLLNDGEHDLAQDAIHDIIFGHNINCLPYITEQEYKEVEEEILEMINMNKEDFQ